jgi:predicted nucleic acid-binding protein
VTVTDASASILALAGNEPGSRHVRARLHSDSLAAPHLVDLEMANGLRPMRQRAQLTAKDVVAALRSLREPGIERYPHVPLLARCGERRENVTPYDASYIAMAEALGVPLLTADARLADAPGIRCEVELLT